MAMTFKLISLILIIIYGGLSMFACAMAIKESRESIFPNLLMITGSVAILLASITQFKSGSNMLYILLLGLISIHVAAIIHGYKLFNKLNLKHHILRGCISLIILLCYYVGYFY